MSAPTREPEPKRLHLVKPDQLDPPETVTRESDATSAAPWVASWLQPDAETAPIEAATAGAPVDATDPGGVGFAASWADLSASTEGRRAPIIPAWLRDKRARRSTLKALIGNVAYLVTFQAVRLPKYAIEAAWYAPIGAGRVVHRLLSWATAEQGNWALRQHAATTNDSYSWMALNKTRAREAKGRWWLLGGGGLVVVVGVTVAVRMAPGWAWLLAGGILTPAAARVGRPADKPFFDHVTTGPRFTRLTAEMVRNALLALRLPAMKEPSSVQFVHPGIHRDGPGWLARVNLPEGMEAVKVLELRGGLSSALRLPIDQVWPSAGPDHAGQLDLWVGYQPASKMGQPAWSLASPTAVANVFEDHEFGTDERQRPVKTCLFERSLLLGGRPGAGKSAAARAVLSIAMMDPTCELKVAELAGKGDFQDLEPLCSTYVNGVDDASLAASAAMISWGLAETERRGERIRKAKRAGLAPDSKVTPELARTPGSGLHPVVILIDECHELFAAIPAAADDAERLIKRARAFGVILILATQIADGTSLPPNIVRCTSVRWCLSVQGQIENDMILGTGAYKRGVTATVYRPGIDAGWGMVVGLEAATAVRSHKADPTTAAAMVAHALALRGGHAIGSDGPEVARDLLSDLLAATKGNGQHWGPAAAELVERWPEAYPGLTADVLSEMARAAGVGSVDVKLNRRVAKGYRADSVRWLIAGRSDSSESGR